MRAAKGFTLIELLTVIAIIGILMTIIMVSLGSAKSKSRDSRRIADIKNIQLALSLYYNDNGMFPKDIYSTSGAAPLNGLSPTYLPSVPIDPLGTSYACGGENPSTGHYCYRAYSSLGNPACNGGTNPPVKYHVGAILEESTNGALTSDANAPAAGSGSMTGFTACSTGTTPDFNGKTTDCTTSADATSPKCYDQTP
ncbi:MAG TPA: prepilin-type N-terminal cleavage/methylation domain-containing protein [Candidatus Paceibacterota bacterium]|jgi:general secretion pathway protein G|nr:prepilin-type N-terminal cleavage/methylation domain-containing protein [Candidatus Paceibacterota bacterium]